MFARLRYLLGWILSVFRSRDDLVLENLALRQQLLALHAKRPRPRLGALDKLFWVLLRRVWSGWKRSLILVTPETVVRWHRAGFRLYWSWVSRARKALGSAINDVDGVPRRIKGDGGVPGQNLDPFELRSVGQLMPVRSLSAQEERQPADAEVWVAVREQNRYGSATVQLTRSKRGADTSVATSND